MLPDNLLFIQVVPQDYYFQWQIEVQILNFRKFNISDRMHILVWTRKDSTEIEKWNEIQRKYPEAKIFMYEDEGVNLGLYISQLRPHTLKKHFKKFPELSEKVLFYHDSDIIFNYLPPFDALCKGEICWQSDTSSYLDYNYLHRKQNQGKIENDEAIKLLAEIGGIPLDVIKSYADKTGGAQTILRGIDSPFWEDVERQCIEIRQKFWYGIKGSINDRFFSNENEGFQSWCADMWALNFALWSRGKITDITPDLDFSWATDSYETYLKKPIMHNAGADGSNKNIFYKGAYINKSPFADQNLPHDPTTASSVYVDSIRAVIS